MNLSALSLSLLSLAASLAVLSGCGQDVPSCNTVCAGASAECATTCMDMETRCDSANDSSDFQALLTCVGNAGATLTQLPELCQPAQSTVNANCVSTPIPTGH